MRVKVWVHPKGIIRVSVTGKGVGIGMPLDDVNPGKVQEWLEKAEMDRETRKMLMAYLEGWT